jgi:putative membrane protein
MLIAAQIVAALAALLHIVFFVFESVLWTRPTVYRRFGIASQEQANTIRPMAYNQGFYNLALALGLIVGVVLIGCGVRDCFLIGKTLIIFATACMALAGVVLATTGRHYLRAAVVQFLPAAIALVLALLA